MPQYNFLNEKTGELKTLFFHMNDDKKFIDEDGYQWVRQFSNPSAQIDSKLDINDSKSFVKYTSSRRGTVGDLLDLSAECSEKRAGTTGQDILKQKAFNEYSSKRRGMLHPQQKKEKARKELKKFGVTVTD